MSFHVGIRSLGGTVFFQVGLCTPLRTMNLHDICIYHLSTLYSKKKEDGRGRQQISTNKTCYEIKKILTFLLSIEGGSGEARVAGGRVCNFFKKKKLN